MPRPPLPMPQGQVSMKRTADSIENDPLVTAATATTETTQYKTAKRKDIGAQEDSSNLMTDETCLDKLRKSLFNRPCVVFPPRPPAPFKIGYDGVSFRNPPITAVQKRMRPSLLLTIVQFSVRRSVLVHPRRSPGMRVWLPWLVSVTMPSPQCSGSSTRTILLRNRLSVARKP